VNNNKLNVNIWNLKLLLCNNVNSIVIIQFYLLNIKIIIIIIINHIKKSMHHAFSYELHLMFKIYNTWDWSKTNRCVSLNDTDSCAICIAFQNYLCVIH
jgi:hypothetical protein